MHFLFNTKHNFKPALKSSFLEEQDNSEDRVPLNVFSHLLKTLYFLTEVLLYPETLHVNYYHGY